MHDALCAQLAANPLHSRTKIPLQPLSPTWCIDAQAGLSVTVYIQHCTVPSKQPYNVRTVVLSTDRQGSRGSSGDDGHAAVNRDRKHNDELGFLRRTRAMSTVHSENINSVPAGALPSNGSSRRGRQGARASEVLTLTRALEGHDVEIIQTSCRRFTASQAYPLASRITMQAATARARAVGCRCC